MPRLPIVVVTTDPPPVVTTFSQQLAKRYPHLKLAFLTDEDGQATATYCGGTTPCAFLASGEGRLLLQQDYYESDADVTARILKTLGGDLRAHTILAKKR
ncbi:MAG: hypothetical protein RMK49_15905 [Abditibacteriales bacterium]|nr:hypothetical protein [Abditibacteriales bacterium]